MKLLLDTHAWLWFHLGDSQLSPAARRDISSAANTKFISPASYWEISVKISLGKYVLNVPYAQFMHDSITGQGFEILHITTAHTEAVTTLPLIHRDPFDRLLISQAKTEGMFIVSGDRNFAAYDVPVFW